MRWAFTTTEGANWHPLAWLSHMLDCRLFGLDPRGHHLTSLVLHALNAVLLFLALDRMTGAKGKSAVVAALFALHPLHVESVAWIAERKDLLSASFWFLTMWFYVRYVELPGIPRYLWVLLTFVLGLLAKPMLVTLPFVLLLLDHWPLGRAARLPAGRRWTLVREKAPLLVLAGVWSAITFVVQRRGGALGSMEQYPLASRIANALVSYVVYLRKTLWPVDLAVFYPHPGAGLPVGRVAGAAVLLAAVSILAARLWRRHPYVPVGWFWFVGTLVPVVGLVQVGEQAMADRYTYVPLVGLFVIVAWGATEALRRFCPPAPKWGAAALAVVVILALAMATRLQVRHWRDSVALFEHALAVTHRNYVAQINLGLAMTARGDLVKAADHYGRALEIRRDSSVAHNNLGFVLSLQGRTQQAMEHYSAALAIDPDYAQAHANLGMALAAQGRLEEASPQLAAAVLRNPDDAGMRYNWGTTLARLKRWDEAIVQLRAVVRLRPDHAEAHSNLGAALYFQGDYPGAWTEVKLARKHGYEPPPGFLQMLSQKMPEPSGGE